MPNEVLPRGSSPILTVSTFPRVIESSPLEAPRPVLSISAFIHSLSSFFYLFLLRHLETPTKAWKFEGEEGKEGYVEGMADPIRKCREYTKYVLG